MFELTPVSVGLMIGIFVVCAAIFIAFVRSELK